MGRIEPRLAEVKHLGFERMLLPQSNLRNLEALKGMVIIAAKRLGMR